MKYIKYITCITISLFSISLMAMQAIQTEFSKPGKDLVILKSNDGIEFKVDVDLAKKSNLIKGFLEDVGTEQSIDLPNVTAKDLEQLLILLDTEVLKKDLTILDLINLAEKANYLDTQNVKDLLTAEIARILTWDKAIFLRLCNSKLDYKDKNRILGLFVEKLLESPSWKASPENRPSLDTLLRELGYLILNQGNIGNECRID